MSTTKLRCGVVGVGRMGAHHARVYAQAENVEFVGVVDVDPQRCRETVEQWGGKAYQHVDELLKAGVDAVSIATPTIHHRAAAEILLDQKVACLIEKPLAPDAAEARIIADSAERNQAVLQVGHIVRYDPVMLAIRKITDLNPRFIEMVRISPMTFRSVDVSVVLDMMIHDLDLLLMLLGSEPEEIQANAVCVVGELEDVCNARLTFPPDEHGIRCVANVTSSRLAMKTERKLRIISEDTYVSADFVARQGTVVHKTANAQQLADMRDRLRTGEDLSNIDYMNLVKVDSLQIDEGEPLRLQIEDFLHAVRHQRRPQVDAQTGFAAVHTAERIIETARKAGSRMV